MKMTIFDYIKQMNIDEFAEWVYEHGLLDDSPWVEWFDNTYCKKCEPVTEYIDYLNTEVECSQCEYNGKCPFFKDMEEAPDMKEIIKLWLENEYTE